MPVPTSFMSSKLFVLIDAQSLIYQAYYALESMSTSRGIPTGAIFGFYQILKKALSLYSPQYLLVAFDAGKKTFRHDLYDEYKKNRPSTPELLIPQIQEIKKLLAAMKIPYIEKANYEADDIIATAVNTLEKELEGSFYIISSDKDLYQLLDKKVCIVKHAGGRFIEVDRQSFEKKYGILPQQVPDYLALVGDASDNIPGVKGVGPKTAHILLNKYDSLESLFAQLDHLEKEKWKNMLAQAQKQAFKSRDLACLEKNVPVSLQPLSQWKFDPDTIYSRLVEKKLEELEFYSLISKKKEKKRNVPRIEWQWTTGEKFKIDKKMAVIYSEHLNGLGFFDGKYARFLSWKECRKLNPGKDVFLYAYSVKDLLHLAGENGDSIAHWPFWDIKIAEHLLASHIHRLEFNELWKKYLPEHEFPEKTRNSEQLFEQVDLDCLAVQSWGMYNIGLKMYAACKQDNLDEYYLHFEKPLIPVLYSMEKNGIAVDVAAMQKLINELQGNIIQLEQEIYKSAGKKFNIQSPRQLQEILFTRMGLKPVKKTKTGYSTDSKVLETLAVEYPHIGLPENILEYRSYSKLLNTYLEPFLELAKHNQGRIQTRFEQTATATGRLSSSEPNLQNIPVRGIWGNKMRKVFIPRTGYKLLSADYSQIELRVIAHFSNDKRLVEYFHQDKDIHIMTAANIFHCEPDSVTSEKRRIAKAVNFGLIYGKSSFGLAKELKISPQEAKQFINQYFLDFSGVKVFIEQLYKQAMKDGFVKTLHGRIRFIPELKARNKMLVEAARRQAINTVIQGTAAEIIKLAMIDIHEKMHRERMQTNMALQIHDELLFEVPPGEEETLEGVVISGMEQAVDLRIPLRCSLAWGQNWCK